MMSPPMITTRSWVGIDVFVMMFLMLVVVVVVVVELFGMYEENQEYVVVVRIKDNDQETLQI